ncbi:MAG: DNA polymerase IV [Candidatus Methanomethylophilaceae archaeon]|nr:DNA polymerase IV [Candidatus Methanomethylophilaceae archaeon]
MIVIHVDMDAFYASVEIRDDPSLRGKPVIIGALPDERGVVATCSYEAREFGVRSGMNIKEAYRLCPDGIYIHPNFDKYTETSRRLHSIWDPYASVSEPMALDETYLDVTSAGDFDRAAEIAREIKKRTLEELGLTCSVGLSYCKAAAKIASEELKPNGYYEIRTREEFVSMMSGREVRELYSVGPRTAKKLNDMGIMTVSQITERRKEVEKAFGKHGVFLCGLAEGIDERPVEPYRPEDAKSVSREITFQSNIDDIVLLMDVILILSISIYDRSSKRGLYGNGVSLKVTYTDMESVVKTRNKVNYRGPLDIAKAAWDLLRKTERKPVRLIGVGIINLDKKKARQTTLFEMDDVPQDDELDHYLEKMHVRYHFDFRKNMDRILAVDRIHGVSEHMRIQRMKERKR